MPPSGYSSGAVNGFSTFHVCNWNDLLAEVRAGKHASFELGIKHEVALIDKATPKLQSGIVNAGLALTKAGYEMLLDALPSYSTPEAAIAATARNVERTFAQIHIDNDGNLVERKVA